MRKMVVFSLLTFVFLMAVWVALFKRDQVAELWMNTWARMRGYGPAKTPEDALDKFRKALQNRDYKTAAKFCTGGYKVQMEKGAEAATKLGSKLEQLKKHCDRKELTYTDAMYQAVDYIDPTRNPFLVCNEFTYNVTQRKDEHALAVINGPRMYTPIQVELKLEGAEGDKSWKINFPMPTDFPAIVDRHLIVKHKDYIKAIEKVIDEIIDKENVSDKHALERRMKLYVEEAARN